MGATKDCLLEEMAREENSRWGRIQLRAVDGKEIEVDFVSALEACARNLLDNSDAEAVTVSVPGGLGQMFATLRLVSRDEYLATTVKT